VIAWLIFSAIVLGMLAIDLLVVRRGPHGMPLREALARCAVWIGVAALFNLGVYVYRGPQAGLEFLTAYVIEESLSVDNLFVFLLIFAHFRVPDAYRHTVLFWGILGALVMRLVFIAAGVSLLQNFHWVIYVFGAILIVSGVRMARGRGPDVRPEQSRLLRWFRRVFPVVDGFEGGKFFVTRDGRRFATTLFVVLLMVEATDLVFAVDSIPAVLAVSRDPFIVYTSNVFAIIGLRTLFFALARLLDLFHFLRYGLALILVFVGAKMLLSHWVEVPIALTLGMVGGTIAVCTAASIVFPRKAPPAPGA